MEEGKRKAQTAKRKTVVSPSSFAKASEDASATLNIKVAKRHISFTLFALSFALLL